MGRRADSIQRSAASRCHFPLLPPGPRQPRCILGVGAGVPAVRHRDEGGASAGAEQEAAEHGGSGKRRRCRRRHDLTGATPSSKVPLSAGGEEPGLGGPDRPRPAAERGPQSAHGQLPDSHSVRVLQLPLLAARSMTPGPGHYCHLLATGVIACSLFIFIFIFPGSQADFQGGAGPEGGPGEADRPEPEPLSGKRAADVQAEAPSLVPQHPPARHGARAGAQMIT